MNARRILFAFLLFLSENWICRRYDGKGMNQIFFSASPFKNLSIQSKVQLLIGICITNKKFADENDE